MHSTLTAEGSRCLWSVIWLSCSHVVSSNKKRALFDYKCSQTCILIQPCTDSIQVLIISLISLKNSLIFFNVIRTETQFTYHVLQSFLRAHCSFQWQCCVSMLLRFALDAIWASPQLWTHKGKLWVTCMAADSSREDASTLLPLAAHTQTHSQRPKRLSPIFGKKRSAASYSFDGCFAEHLIWLLNLSLPII